MSLNIIKPVKVAKLRKSSAKSANLREESKEVIAANTSLEARGHKKLICEKCIGSGVQFDENCGFPCYSCDGRGYTWSEKPMRS